MTEERFTAAELGRKGGETTYKLHGADHYREMQRKGIETKLKRKKIAQALASK